MKRVLIVLSLLASSAVASEYQPRAGASGAQIFSDACAACHGADGSGKFGLFLGLTGSTLMPDEMKTVIQQGGAVMPAFSNIQGKELDALVAYVRSLGAVIAGGDK